MGGKLEVNLKHLKSLVGQVNKLTQMLVLGSILAPSMLHTAFPAFPVVVPPSESRRMISTWQSHNRVFRLLLLTFVNSDIICDESQDCWGHFALLVVSI